MLSGSRLSDCLIETSCEGLSKTAVTEGFRLAPLPVSRHWINFALPWTRRLCGIREMLFTLSHRSQRVGMTVTG